MKRDPGMLLLAVLLAALFTLPASAQTGSVKGKALDEKGQPISGATVEWLNSETGRRIAVKTNRRGEYFSLGVPQGIYTVTLTKDGKTLFTHETVQVISAEERNLEFDLSKRAVTLHPDEITAEQREQLTEEQQKQLEVFEKERATVRNLNELLAQAGAAQKAGNHEEAVRLLNRAVEIDATRDLLWGRLGDANLAAKQFEPAAQAFQRAISITDAAGKPSGAYYNNLGQAYIGMGRTEDAMQAYTRAAELEPANAALYFFNLGAVLTNVGKADEATAAFDKAIAANPDHAEAHYWKGVNLLGKATLDGDRMVAPLGTAEAFNKYLQLQPNGPYAEAARGMLESIGAKVETQIGRPRRR